MLFYVEMQNIPDLYTHVAICCRSLQGCVEFLEQPAMAFVRLDEAVLLESVLEVPVPVRFIFVLLGPSQSSVDCHEIGRSFSTLMSDKVHDGSSQCPRDGLIKSQNTRKQADLKRTLIYYYTLGTLGATMCSG